MSSEYERSKVGFPIRKSSDQSSFAAPQGLSQRTTSFIASQRQGIHRMLLRHLIALMIDVRRPQARSRPHDQKDHVFGLSSEGTLLARTHPARDARSRRRWFAETGCPACRICSLFTISNIRGRALQAPAANRLDDTGQSQQPLWWSQTGSNRRPHACKARALPTELWPRSQIGSQNSKPRPFRSERWWAWDDSNVRPHPYQGCALTT